jgi:hypothetical protein
MAEQEEMMKDQDRFDALLPWYVNGTLVNGDRMWMDEFVRVHPEAASELRLQQTLQTTLRGDATTIPANIGLDKLLQRVRQERSTAPARSLLGQINDTLGTFFAGLHPTPAMAAAFAVILVQAGVIGTLMLRGGAQEGDLEHEYAQMRSIEPSVALEGPFLKINFKPDARESDMRFALVSVGGSVVAGPSQLGDYFVKVPAAGIEAASDQLRSSGLVESIVVVQSLPNKG